MNDSMHDPTPDRLLQAALRSLDPGPQDVNWFLLRRSIEERAALSLAHRRSRKRRARWLRPILPAVAAAGLATVLTFQVFTPAAVGTHEPAELAVVRTLRPVFEEVLGAPLSDAELDLLLGEVSADRLVVAALTSH